MNKPSQHILDTINEFMKMKSLSNYSKKYPEEYKQVIEITSFLPSDASIRQRFIHIINELDSIPLCQVCGKKSTKWKRNNTDNFGYNRSCGLKCGGILSKQTILEKPENIKLINETSYLLSATLAQRQYHIDNNLVEVQLCKHCGSNPVKWNGSSYADTCSSRCATSYAPRKAKYEKTLQETYGTDIINMSRIDDVKQQKKLSALKKFGVDNVSQAPEIKQKKIDSHKKRTGYDHPMQDPATREKSIATNLCVRGVKYASQDPEVIKKCKKTVFDTIKKIHYNQLHIPAETEDKLSNYEFMYDLHVIQQKPMDKIAMELGVSDGLIARRLANLNIMPRSFSGRSIGEKEVADFVLTLLPENEVVLNTTKIIDPVELDIYVPKHNFAIEYNGLYYHNELHKDTYFHFNKTHNCLEKNIKLFHVYEDDWRDRREIVKKMIINSLGLSPRGIGANKTIIQQMIPKQEMHTFYTDNHIQGFTNSSIDIGLRYNDNLVACVSFVEYENGYFNLVRYATSIGVAGGFSKLMKFFMANYNWRKIITFADLSHSIGNLYERTGWTLDAQLSPDYQYIVNKTRVHKAGYRRKYLKTKLTNFDPLLSEHQNMINHGIYRIYNSGLLRYIITK